MIAINLNDDKFNNEAQTSSVKEIIPEIILKIFEYLNEGNLMNLSFVSKRWRLYTQQISVLQQVLQNRPYKILENHLPQTDEIRRPFYPKIGHLLTAADLGESVVRTRPNEVGDFSFVPPHVLGKYILFRFGKNDTLFIKYSLIESIYEVQNDGYWVTEEEFIEHTKSPDFEKFKRFELIRNNIFIDGMQLI